MVIYVRIVSFPEIINRYIQTTSFQSGTLRQIINMIPWGSFQITSTETVLNNTEIMDMIEFVLHEIPDNNTVGMDSKFTFRKYKTSKGR